jgi:hypothetical protein
MRGRSAAQIFWCKLEHSRSVMVITLISILVASILVLASHVIAGRLVALLSTAVFMPMLAYFMMPPYR